LVSWPHQHRIGRPGCIVGATVPPGSGRGITLKDETVRAVLASQCSSSTCMEELRAVVRPEHRGAVEMGLYKLDASVAESFPRPGLGSQPGTPIPSLR
jgi:hypothetical protein